MGKKKQRPNNPRKNQYLTDDQKHNKLFIEYYQNNGVISSQEWDKFFETINSDLPSTFRLCGFRDQSRVLLDLIRNRLIQGFVENNEEEKETKNKNSDEKLLTEVESVETGNFPDQEGASTSVSVIPLLGNAANLIQQLPWYPGGLAWQINAPKMAIRRHPLLKRVHSFMVSETESGHISRQEAVSMLPPLIMRVRPHHRVLDMCAAPGSKTAQLVEALHNPAFLALPLHAGSPPPTPTGFIIANDVDSRRCYLTVHQLKRLQSPSVVMMRQDATRFPRLHYPISAGGGGNEGCRTEPLLFDRILADVPCSGDGTLRKNPDLWARWTPSLGLAEHSVQMKILRRALELAKVGGRVVYSTCSLNPVEDEAVIAAMLRDCRGSVRLLDMFEGEEGDKSKEDTSVEEQEALRKLGSEFVTRPGMSSWRVMLSNGQWIDRFEELAGLPKVTEKLRSLIRPSMFPPTNKEIMSEKEKGEAEDDKTEKDDNQTNQDDLRLDLCRRVLPHDNNSGGFFLALLEKVDELPWTNRARRAQSAVVPVVSAPTPANDNADVTPQEKPLKKSLPEGAPDVKRRRIFKEDPYLFLSENDKTVATNEQDQQESKEAAAIRAHFEASWTDLREFYALNDAFPRSQLLYRSEAGRRRFLYFAAQPIKQLVQCNGAAPDVNFVNLGVKVFAHQEYECGDAATSEAAAAVVAEVVQENANANDDVSEAVAAFSLRNRYRLIQDGLPIVLPYLGANRIFELDNRNDLVLLLTEDSPLISSFSEAAQHRFSELQMGAVVFSYRPASLVAQSALPNQPEAELPRCHITFSGWRGKVSIRNHIGNAELNHYLIVCGLELNQTERRSVEKATRGVKRGDEERDQSTNDAGEKGAEPVHDDV